MDPEFADLVPLFVGEARGRLERLAALAPRTGGDREATAEVKRELHTLKGAGRMLRLEPLAELCHAAEGAIQAQPAGLGALVVQAVDRLAAMVDQISAGRDPERDEPLLQALATPGVAVAQVPGAQPAVPVPAAAIGASDDLRIDPATMDSLADRSTRLRILALGAATYPTRLFDLARLAEEATREAEPEQVLPVLAASLRRLAIELESGQQRLQRLAESHLDRLLSLQLQPLRPFFLNLSRHARELARSLGRELEVVTRGDETRLDRRIVAALEEALIHLVRNAVDHGVEPPDRRQAEGKPRVGTLTLGAATAGSRVRITITDDGAGIDPDRILAAAIDAGLVDEAGARTMSPTEILRLVFAPGFSTRRDVSELSGRGVGLDAVAAVVARVGGSVRIEAEVGKGTSFVLEVPAAMRGETVLVVRAGQLRLALPAAVVRSATRLTDADIVERGARVFANLPGRLVPFAPLARALGETPAPVQLLLEGTVGGQPVALAVDAVESEQEVLVRPLIRAAAVTPLFEGLALLASGEPVAVLSPLALSQREATRAAPSVAAPGRARKLRVLLVDDSLVTREMERRLLEDAGFDVVAAGDAAEALTHLAESTFECVVTDVEMPGMDGLELTRRMRAIPHLAQLPVVVVSTRDRPEDRLRGLEAGADAYLAKQGLDATELTGLVRRLGGR